MANFGPHLIMREATDEDRRLWPHAQHVVEPVLAEDPLAPPVMPGASRWEREQYAARMARFFGGAKP